jgi:triosephosphate isomerase (TIM)
MARMIIAGNWKMNTSLAEAVKLAGQLRESLAPLETIERILIPPFPWIVPVHDQVQGSGLKVGAQNCYSEPKGAFTGEVAPEMLAGLCHYVIAGHSERRHVLGETDEVVASKVNAILRAGLRAILCVGETLAEREAGSAETVVGRQLKAGLDGLGPDAMANVVVAYEPVWAIGTGKAASEGDAQTMSEFIRTSLSERFGSQVATDTSILYGGSVKGDNAAGFMACPDVNGALVGGASLDAAEFTAIARSAVDHAN